MADSQNVKNSRTYPCVVSWPYYCPVQVWKQRLRVVPLHQHDSLSQMENEDLNPDYDLRSSSLFTMIQQGLMGVEAAQVFQWKPQIPGVGL